MILKQILGARGPGPLDPPVGPKVGFLFKIMLFQLNVDEGGLGQIFGFLFSKNRNSGGCCSCCLHKRLFDWLSVPCMTVAHHSEVMLSLSQRRDSRHIIHFSWATPRLGKYMQLCVVIDFHCYDKQEALEEKSGCHVCSGNSL